MRKALRYNELDELAWEAEHGCDVYGDIDDEDEFDWYEENVLACGSDWHEDCPEEEPTEDDEPCDFENGIMGSDIRKSHECNEFKPLPGGYEEIGDIFHVVGIGRISGFGTGEDIALAMQSLMVKDRQYHYEFEFFENK